MIEFFVWITESYILKLFKGRRAAIIKKFQKLNLSENTQEHVLVSSWHFAKSVSYMREKNTGLNIDPTIVFVFLGIKIFHLQIQILLNSKGCCVLSALTEINDANMSLVQQNPVCWINLIQLLGRNWKDYQQNIEIKKKSFV